MGYEKNKILLPFGDKYLFEYPLDTFLSFGFEVICVISKEDEEEVSKVNKNLVNYKHIKRVIRRDTEFDKTTSKKIRRQYKK